MKKRIIKMAILSLLALVIYLGSIMLGIYITETSGNVPQTNTLRWDVGKQ